MGSAIEYGTETVIRAENSTLLELLWKKVRSLDDSLRPVKENRLFAGKLGNGTARFVSDFFSPLRSLLLLMQGSVCMRSSVGATPSWSSPPS